MFFKDIFYASFKDPKLIGANVASTLEISAFATLLLLTVGNQKLWH
jgi:hypothetical protein